MVIHKTLVLNLSPELLARIDDFWHEHRLRSRSEAIRKLLEDYLDREASK